ncbi:MAG: hypothetical protein RLZZ222_657, partial [Actinomycetota bacterium]
MAMVNITVAIIESRIFQNIGFDINREAARAPKPIVENQTTLATAPPMAKNQRSS